MSPALLLNFVFVSLLSLTKAHVPIVTGATLEVNPSGDQGSGLKEFNVNKDGQWSTIPGTKFENWFQNGGYIWFKNIDRAGIGGNPNHPERAYLNKISQHMYKVNFLKSPQVDYKDGKWYMNTLTQEVSNEFVNTLILFACNHNYQPIIVSKAGEAEKYMIFGNGFTGTPAHREYKNYIDVDQDEQQESQQVYPAPVDYVAAPNYVVQSGYSMEFVSVLSLIVSVVMLGILCCVLILVTGFGCYAFAIKSASTEQKVTYGQVKQEEV